MKTEAIVAPAEDSILVLAPHPDDESLTAAGVIRTAVKNGRSVYVAVATNGDLKGKSLGLQREQESVAALTLLGVPEDHVIFLGYGDQTLRPMWKSASAIECITSKANIKETYAASGLGKKDFHSYLVGKPAAYTRENFIDDLKNLIRLAKPTQIFVSSIYDQHPDHKNLNRFLLRAVAVLNEERAFESDLPQPRIFESVVHFASDGKNWGGEGFAPASHWEIPSALETPESKRGQVVRMAVPDEMNLSSADENLKAQVLRAYASQLGAASFLLSFVKEEEIFWELDLKSRARSAVLESSDDLSCEQ